jgi:hypothetical protein
MKKILILLFTSFIAFSCSLKLMPREVRTAFFDYRHYANEGFFISPDPYTGEFTPCGELLISIVPGDVKVSGKQVYDPASQMYSTFDDVRKEDISSKELLDIAVKKAKEVGADGLVNFKCLVVNSSYYNPGLKQVITFLSHYEISGYAIKRK